MWKRLLLAVGIFFSGISAAQDPNGESGKLPRSWHLRLETEQIEAIQRQFREPKFESLRLPAGLYAQDLRRVVYRAELSPGNLISEVDFDLPRFPGTSHLGFAPTRPNEPQELWLVLPNNQRFQLAKFRTADQIWEPSVLVRVPPSDYHWLPADGGVVSFDTSWRAFYQPYAEAARRRPDATAEGVPFIFSDEKSGSTRHVQILGMKREGIPGYGVLFYHQASNQLAVFLGDGTPTPQTVSVAILKLGDMSTKLIGTEIPWPAALSNSAVHSVKDGVLQAQDIDWEKGALRPVRDVRRLDTNETMESLGTLFFIQKSDFAGTNSRRYLVDADGTLLPYTPQVNSFAPVGQEQDEAMISFTFNMSSGTKLDLLEELNSGAKIPAYSDAQVVKGLAKNLGESRNTWTILVYQDGQMPNELMADFVWKISTESVNVTRALTPIDRVYNLPGKLFNVQTSEELNELMGSLSRVIRKRRAIAYLPDFPASREFELGSARERLVQFWNFFNEGIAAGESRVVFSMRQEVFDDLLKNEPSILRDAKVIRVPALSPKETQGFVEATKTRLERQRGKRFTPEAFSLFSDYLAKAGSSSGQASPGREITSLGELFDFLETHNSRSSEIDRRAIQEWMDGRTGQDAVRRRLDPQVACEALRNKIVSHDEVIDDLCVAFTAIKQGQRLHERGPLAKFILLGSTGTGKTLFAETFADLLTGKDSLILVNMSEFNRITPGSALHRKLKEGQDQVKVILFDDVDQVPNKEAIERLADMMDIGIYGKESEAEIDFRNTVVFWTSNWAEKLLQQDVVNDLSLHEKLGSLLTEATTLNPDPPLRQRVWARIENVVYPLMPFTEPQMLELGVVVARAKLAKLRSEQFKHVKIDPQVLMEIAAQERQAKSGARAVVNRLDKDVLKKPAFLKALLNKEVSQIVVTQNVGPEGGITVVTNVDADFEVAWNNPEIPDILEWKETQDQLFVARYLQDYGDTVGIPRVQTDAYRAKYPRKP